MNIKVRDDETQWQGENNLKENDCNRKISRVPEVSLVFV